MESTVPEANARPHSERAIAPDGAVQQRVVGTVGLYDDPDTLLRAARELRDAGYRRWDCHTPYPVHGLDEAMGLRPSTVPFWSIGAAFVGLAVAIALTGGLSVWQYPIRIGGKALFSWQAFVPIFFELFVLFSAVATMMCILGYCKLGRWHSPLHDSDIMKDVTCDRFAIVVEDSDPHYDENALNTLLAGTGCTDIRPLIEHVQMDESFL